MRCAVTLLAPLLACLPPSLALAEQVPFTAVLEIRASVGTSTESFPLLSLETAGVAAVDAGVVRIPAAELTGLVPELSGFGGSLVNGPATFQAGGAGAGSSCPLTQVQEVCIEGGGFGGVMQLGGVSQAGQAIPVWGVEGTGTGSTASGVPRTVRGRRWTQGNAAVWYYVTEVDPATPFLLSASGSFRGLPSTFAGEGLPGFSLVTPVALTSALPTSEQNVRGIAVLRIDFARPVPVGGIGVLALLLGALGAARLKRRA